jgi:gas vesicle protein
MTHLENTKSNTTRNLSYLLIGGGIGATLALLFAPKSGSELRSDISSAATTGYDKARETVGQIRENAGTYYGNVKEKANHLYQSSTEALKGVAGDVNKLPKKAENFVQDKVERVEAAVEEGKKEFKDSKPKNSSSSMV